MESKLLGALKYISLISVFHHDSLETLKLYSGIIDLYSKVKAIAKTHLKGWSTFVSTVWVEVVVR